MDIFYNRIKEICEKNKKVAMFIDMDGTIVEYKVYQEGTIKKDTRGEFIEANPIEIVIEKLKKINEISNIDLYILSLSKTNIIVEEKKKWLRKYASFIEENNWIIINKEANEYNSENRDYIKSNKIKEKMNDYDFAILIDDDHKILKQAQADLKEKGNVFHLSSVII